MLDLSYMLNDMTTERTEERKNRFNGESIMLTKEEAKIHDRLFINELAATLEDKAAGYDGATMPSEADVNAKIQEIKDEETAEANKKASGKQKLKDLGLDDDEIKALIGV